MKTITINVPDDCEVQIVKKEEPIIRTYQDLIDNNIEISGVYISPANRIVPYKGWAHEDNKNVASSEKIAKSMLAMAQISQLMPYYGGAITDEEWKDTSQCKFTIERDSSYHNNIASGCRQISYYFPAFHTAEHRDNFLKYNEQLVKDYLMID